MKLDCAEIPNGFLVTIGYTERKTSLNISDTVLEVLPENVEKNPLEKAMKGKSGKKGTKSIKSSEKSSEKIVRVIKNNPWVTIEELSILLGKTTRAVEKKYRQAQSQRVN